VIRVCFHGAESTGKSTLARKLADRFGCPLVPEYGRIHAEERGTEFTLGGLLGIAREQDRLMHEAAWAEMLFGEVPDELLRYPKAELYLLFQPDVPWVDDGTRFFGTPELRARFAAVAEAMLVRAGVPFRTVAGDWDERERQAVAAIEVRRRSR